MSAPRYSAAGPVAGQDARPVWIVLKDLRGLDSAACRARIVIEECLSEAAARRRCDELNQSEARACGS